MSSGMRERPVTRAKYCNRVSQSGWHLNFGNYVCVTNNANKNHLKANPSPLTSIDSPRSTLAQFYRYPAATRLQNVRLAIVTEYKQHQRGEHR